MKLSNGLRCSAAAFAALLVAHAPVAAQTIAAPFSGSYSIIFNANVPSVPGNYGGVNFLPGDANTLVLGGSANTANADIYALPVTRGVGGHITGFGSATTLANANGTGGGIDGGLVFEPTTGVLLYTSYSSNQLGMVKPSSFFTNAGSGGPDKLVTLTGVSGSVGTLQYVPTGFGGAGKLKVVSYNGGDWHDLTLTPDGNGTFNVAVGPTVATTTTGPEGIVYVAAGNPNIGVNSILLSEYSSGRISLYTADGNGNPIVGSRQDFITGLSGALGGVMDPLTGDFIFSTFGASNRLVVVSGFTAPAADVPEPGVLALGVGGLAGMGLLVVRRRRK
jgi:hypothetical protein